MAKNDATQLKERKSDDSQTITDLSGDAVGGYLYLQPEPGTFRRHFPRGYGN